MMTFELFAALDDDETVVIGACPLIRIEHSLSLKLARAFISRVGSVGTLRQLPKTFGTVWRPYLNRLFLLKKLCLIPPFSP